MFYDAEKIVEFSVGRDYKKNKKKTAKTTKTCIDSDILPAFRRIEEFHFNMCFVVSSYLMYFSPCFRRFSEKVVYGEHFS